MRHNIASTMIMCPGAAESRCDRIITIDYDMESGKVTAEGCFHVNQLDDDELLNLAFDSFPSDELEKRRLPRRGRRVPKHDPRIDEEGVGNIYTKS
jgi:hypothetical protein